MSFEGLRLPPPVEELALRSLAERLRLFGGEDLKSRVSAEELARALIPRSIWREPGDFHKRFWSWLDHIGEQAPRPYLAIWFRGSGKSTNAEIAVVFLGANRLRSYVLYVSRTQPRADDHVGNIGALLESREVAERWPLLATRAVGKYGSARGWRRNRLVTRGGLIVDALGLDASSRGLKLEFKRPDGAVLDDIDHHTDSLTIIQQHIEKIGRGIGPALASNAVVCIIQNKIHPDGVVAQLLDGRSDMFANAIVDGPIPGLLGLPEKAKAPEGTPTWPEGFGLEEARNEWTRIGEISFRREIQHEVEAREGAMFQNVVFTTIPQEECPPLLNRELWIDPAVGAGATGSLCGFIAGGVGVGNDGQNRLYVEWAHEERMLPEEALRFAAAQATRMDIHMIGVETDQGGETWRPLAQNVFKDYGVRWAAAQPVEEGKEPLESEKRISFTAAKAGSTGMSKYERWLRLLAGYERSEVIHVSNQWWDCGVLERALLRLPDREPFDLADVSYWLWWSVLDKNRVRWRAV